MPESQPRRYGKNSRKSMEIINPEKYYHWREEKIQTLCLSRLQRFLQTTMQIYREILIRKTNQRKTERGTNKNANHITNTHKTSEEHSTRKRHYTSTDYKKTNTRDAEVPAIHI